MPNELPIKPDRQATDLSGPAERALTNPATEASFAHGLSKTQLAVAFVIAGLSDALGVFVMLTPPLAWGLDLLTAVLLFVVLGWRWLILPGLLMEAIPGIGVFPFWLLVVAGIAVWGTTRPSLRGESTAPLVLLIEKLKGQK